MRLSVVLHLLFEKNEEVSLGKKAAAKPRRVRSLIQSWAAWGVPVLCLGSLLQAQGRAPVPALPQGAPGAWVEAAALNQNHIINDGNHPPLMYRVHKIDAKGDTLREVVESKEGTVARLLQRNGAALTADEDGAERDRLNDILSSPGTFLSHQGRDRSAREYATELVKEMPAAMVWTYTAGQPQLPGVHGTQVVLDFVPDPKYKPPTIVTEGLTGIAGRIWIDSQSHCTVHIEGRVLHPVNFGWGGLLARISEGGVVGFDQAEVPGHRWLYSHLSEHVSIRELMIHTVKENTEIATYEVQQLPSPLGFREAIQALLALPVPTH